MMKPLIVAHRGYAHAFPENTLEAIQASVQGGISSIEVDVQLTNDAIPVLLHDSTLNRTTDAGGSVFDLHSRDISEISAGEPERFGHKFHYCLLPKLSDLTHFAQCNPVRQLFIEIKTESIEAFGCYDTVDIICRDLEPVFRQIVIISYNFHAIEYATKRYQLRTGIVLHEYEEHLEYNNNDLNILICNHRKLPRHIERLPVNRQPWMFYEIETAEEARKLINHGATYLESMRANDLIKELS